MKISVKVHPGSKVEKVENSGGKIEIWTRAKAHDGEANRAVVEILNKKLGVAKTRIRVVSGGKSKEKIVEIED